MQLIVPTIWETQTRSNENIPKQLEHLPWAGAQHSFMYGQWGYLFTQSLVREEYTFAMYQVNIKQTSFTFQAYNRSEKNILAIVAGGILQGTYTLTAGECRHIHLADQSYLQWTFMEGQTTIFLLQLKHTILLIDETTYLSARLLVELQEVGNKLKEHILPGLYLDGLVASLLQAHNEQVQHLEDNRYLAGAPFHFTAADLVKIKGAKAILDAKPDRKHSLRKLAQEAGTNIEMLKKGFKHVYGQTVHQYRLTASLTLAKQMVMTTRKPAKEIASACGFRHYPHFIQQFKRQWGITPGALRKTT